MLWDWDVRTLRVVVGALLGLGLAVWFWDAAIKYQVTPKNFGVVVPGEIYRSGELVPSTTREVVGAHAIRTIVDLGAHEPGTSEERLAQRTAEALGVERFVFDLEGDATGEPEEYLKALRIMSDPARAPVLVHCAAGSERTGACVAFYRMIYEDVPMDEAFAETREHRHNPGRNPLLRETIERWAEPLRRAIEQDLDRVPRGPIADEDQAFVAARASGG